MTKRIIGVCNIVMEVSWLLALVSVPIYFNIYTSRIFEPDKITLFRSLVLVMAMAWLVKGAALWASVPENGTVRGNAAWKRRPAPAKEESYPPDGDTVGPDTRPWTQKLYTRPLLLVTYLLSISYLVSTLFSVVPGVSWAGSYERLQGTYTFLCYVTFFLVIIFNLYEWRQVERIISFVLLTNVPIVLYGLLQHNNADPLPWQGDVTFRVTSTMGNAIFIAAYLIMIVPLAAYRTINTGKWLVENRRLAARSMEGRMRDTALSWGLLYGGFIFFIIGLFSVALNFAASYRPSTGTAQAADQIALNSGTGSGVNNFLGNDTVGPWWALPLAIVLSFGIYFLFTVKRKGTDNNYLFRLIEFACYLLIFLTQILVVVYSKSRGPQGGLLVAMFLLPVLIMARRHIWKWLGGWLGLGLLAGLFLFLFNLPAGSTPLEGFFSQLRKSPEIARFGQFLGDESGTSRVRQLIWKTDFELFQSDAKNEPLRLIIGHGPESMFYVAPPFYQTELAQLEARNAVPDRSHNGYLDTMVNGGVLGVVAYLALVISFFWFAIKFLRKTQRFEYQLLLACLICVMVAHQVEIQAGIQIVSTWMMFWLSCALVVVMGGLIKGSYAPRLEMATADAAVGMTNGSLTNSEKEPEKAAVAKEVAAKEVVAVSNANRVGGKAKANANLGAPKAGQVGKPDKIRPDKTSNEPFDRETRRPRASGAKPLPVTRSARLSVNDTVSYFNNTSLNNVPDGRVQTWFWGLTGIIAAVGVFLIVTSNVVPVLADTAAKQGANLAGVNRWVESVPYLQKAADLAPNEDRYRLNLGQAYLAAASNLSKETDKEKAKYAPEYIQSSERELIRATEIAPLNPDHYANLGRLYGQWAVIEPARTRELGQKSVSWFLQATEKAPRNAKLFTELATAYLIGTQGTETQTDQFALQQATKAAEKAVQIDDRYDTARLLLADVYRFGKRNDDAARQLLALAKFNLQAFGNDHKFLDRVNVMGNSQIVTPEELAAIPIPSAKDSREQRIYYNRVLGIVNTLKGKYSEGEKYLREGLTIAPDDPFDLAYLSVMYQRLQKNDEAKQYAQRAIAALQSTASRSLVNASDLEPYFRNLLNPILQ